MNQTFYGCASITSSQRPQIIKKDGIPGPGTYDPSKEDSARIPLWTLKPKIEYTSCFHSNNTYVPAPGAYEISPTNNPPKNTKANGLKIGKFKDRNSIEKCSPVIALQLPSFVDSGNGFSFGYRDQPIVLETSPGPIYHVSEREEEGRRMKLDDSAGFGFGERSRFERGDNPGPGHYSPSPQKMYTTSGNWSFSKGPRKNKQRDPNPTGPGQYSPKLYTTCRSFKLKGRIPNDQKSDNQDTSPMSYNLPDTKSKIGTVFKKSPIRSDSGDKNQGPSPFSYNIQSTLKAGGYSLAKRLQAVDQNAENPGPGTYANDQQALFAKNGGYICRKQREKKKLSETFDNFCKYQPKTTVVDYKYPQYSFKQSERSSTDKKSLLSPCTYNAIKPSSTESYSIGKSIRFKPLKKQKSFGNLLNQGTCYSSCGYLPPYLKQSKSKNSQAQTRILQIQKQNTPEEK